MVDKLVPDTISRIVLASTVIFPLYIFINILTDNLCRNTTLPMIKCWTVQLGQTQSNLSEVIKHMHPVTVSVLQTMHTTWLVKSWPTDATPNYAIY